MCRSQRSIRRYRRISWILGFVLAMSANGFHVPIPGAVLSNSELLGDGGVTVVFLLSE